MCYAIDFEKQMERRDLYRKLNEIMKTFSERERTIFVSRLQYDIPYKQLGEELGVTSNRVRQIYEKILRMLRHPKRVKILSEYFDVVHDYRKKIESMRNDDKVHVILPLKVYDYNSLKEAILDYDIWRNKLYYIIGNNCKNV